MIQVPLNAYWFIAVTVEGMISFVNTFAWVSRNAYDGRVVSVGEDARSGKYVFLEHEKDVVTFYCHCSEILVKEGDKVSQGDTIALVGSTGYSTGPHLHFEVRIKDVSVDPLPLLRDAADNS